MKRMVITFGLIAESTLTLFGQGRVNFNNFSAIGPQPVTVGIINQGPSGGNAGDYLGNNYSVQLLWAAGTFADYQSFFAAQPSSSAVFAFFGATGNLPSHGPTVDGAGLFDGGTISMNGPAGLYTMQARAWFNGGQFASYAAAIAAGRNAGVSDLIQVLVTASPTPAPNTAFSSFVIPQVPEPSTFVLAGLGMACVLLFCRRKQRGRISSNSTKL